MKKLWILILVLILSACGTPDVTVEVDCDLFPDATVCQDNITELEPVETEEPVVVEPVEEKVSYHTYEYSNGSLFLDSYFSMKLYLKQNQQDHDYYSIYFRMGEKYHYLTDKYGKEREYRFDYSAYVSILDINNNPTTKHYLSDELYDLIAFAVENANLVNGYMDITIDPVSNLWHDLREKCTDYNFNENFCSIPTEEALQEAALFMGLEKIQLNDEEKSIQMEEGMSIDLGAVAKGYFVEQLAQRFILEGVDGFVISAGGNVKTYGVKPDKTNFTVAIQDPFVPRGEGALEEVLSIPGGYSVVSSGDQEKYFMVDGEIYHHIINPFTLYPDHYSRQVTIVTNDSGLADVLSTSVYIMPLEEGLSFIESLESVEALWVTMDGEVIMSSGMEKFITYQDLD